MQRSEDNCPNLFQHNLYLLTAKFLVFELGKCAYFLNGAGGLPLVVHCLRIAALAR